MFEDKIDITLNCDQDVFKSNFRRFIKDKKGSRCSGLVKKRLSGELQQDQISIWYDPRCFNQPFSLPIARGTFQPVDKTKTRIELEVFIEGHYPLTYLIVGIITYLLVVLMFGINNFQNFDFWTIQTALLIVFPFLILIATLISFRHSVKDTRQEIIKYMRIISIK